MGYSSFISYIDLRRPLVFLCGPAYRENEPLDRRSILKKYINKNWTRISNGKEEISALPIIVDTFLKPDFIKKEELSIRINLIEEIIANISYKTYIFLDTMSTSYELGQFTNFAYSTSNVSIFVDKQYDSRNNNMVGEYIKESISSRFIEYEAFYNNKGHIFFPFKSKKRPKIPKDISLVLEEDNPLNKNDPLLYKIEFTTDNKKINDPGVIVCEKNNNDLIFNFSIKNLFYYVSAVFRRMKTTRKHAIANVPKSIKDVSFSLFMDEFKKELLASFICCSKSRKNRSFVLCPDFSITLRVGSLDCEELIYHMLFLSFLLASYGSKKTYAVAEYDRNYFSDGISFSKSEIDFLEINNHHINKLIKKYKIDSSFVGVEFKKLIIKGKSRNIVTYSKNHLGDQLRYLHKELLNNFLYVLPTSDSSFAYKSGKNSSMCIKRHIGNAYFAKYDIKKYFESISQSRLKNKICKYITEQFAKILNKIEYYYKYKNEIESEVRDLIKPMFVKNKLPIGFITSPKISDFYLFDVDEEMQKIDNIIYTRYADDILISSPRLEMIKYAEERLTSLLLAENLIVNYKKVRKGALICPGSSFKFLGINLVKRSDYLFDLTVSTRNLAETSKFIMTLDITNNPSDYEKASGKINYIKNVSMASFLKLKKMLFKKYQDQGFSVPSKLSLLLN